MSAVIGSIIVVDMYALSALLHSAGDSKAAQMNIRSRLIQELRRYEFKLDHKPLDATNNIGRVKDEGDQTRSVRPKTVNFIYFFMAI